MLGNIIDHRANRSTPECDAVFEPSAHDNARRSNGQPWYRLEEAERDPDYFHVLDMRDTTVRDAALHAEYTWSFAVTVYLYDRGSQPLG